MKKIFLIITTISLLAGTVLHAQTLQDARKLYTEGNYSEALPILEKQYSAKPNDASINHWYGVSLYKTRGDLQVAEKCLLLAAKRKILEANMYLGAIYTERYEFDNANKYFEVYEKHLLRKGWRSKTQQEQEAKALEELKSYQKLMQKLRRMVSHTEDIQIIDSVVVDKRDFLLAYSLSFSGGRVVNFSDVFKSEEEVNSTVYINEKETKIYYAEPDEAGTYSLLTMEYLLDHFGNEKMMSADNFGMEGNMNYPFVMPDGVTVYFAAQDEESIGGYDLFVTRYNMNNDTYLKPERLNMPFNSQGNDYMMVIDEEKGVGWFASDRGLDEGDVCIYTFIPNDVVKIIESEDDVYLANRARITSIKDTWVEGVSYDKLRAIAKKKQERVEKKKKDFEFVINDEATYYTLDDFKNPKAREAYAKVVSLNTELQDLTSHLNKLRDEYINANDSEKGKLGNTISTMEIRQRNLRKEISQMEIDARNIEVAALK